MVYVPINENEIFIVFVVELNVLLPSIDHIYIVAVASKKSNFDLFDHLK
jgi:hypothetical protein